MNKILLLGSQHGNELLGECLYAHIRQYQPALLQYTTYRIGNSRAHKRNIRYIEGDLNRSYTGKTTTYEERRAKRILSYIKKEGFDLVLDLHTTICEEPPCIIIPKLTTENMRFIRASSIQKIVEMNCPIVTTSLIGNCSRAVCIEINKDEVNNSTLNGICEDIKRYIAEKDFNQQKDIYTVDNLLEKTEIDDKDAAKLRNFELSSQGFYPILTGENSYKEQTHYLGFKAYKRRSSKV